MIDVTIAGQLPQAEDRFGSKALMCSGEPHVGLATLTGPQLIRSGTGALGSATFAALRPYKIQTAMSAPLAGRPLANWPEMHTYSSD
jgi:hypothetical protein